MTKGINYDQQSDTSDYPVHKVSLSDYWIGKTEVTQRQWGAICGYKDKLLEGKLKRAMNILSTMSIGLMP